MCTNTGKQSPLLVCNTCSMLQILLNVGEIVSFSNFIECPQKHKMERTVKATGSNSTQWWRLRKLLLSEYGKCLFWQPIRCVIFTSSTPTLQRDSFIPVINALSRCSTKLKRLDGLWADVHCYDVVNAQNFLKFSYCF